MRRIILSKCYPCLWRYQVPVGPKLPPEANPGDTDRERKPAHTDYIRQTLSVVNANRIPTERTEQCIGYVVYGYSPLLIPTTTQLKAELKVPLPQYLIINRHRKVRGAEEVHCLFLAIYVQGVSFAWIVSPSDSYIRGYPCSVTIFCAWSSYLFNDGLFVSKLRRILFVEGFRFSDVDKYMERAIGPYPWSICHPRRTWNGFPGKWDTGIRGKCRGRAPRSPLAASCGTTENYPGQSVNVRDGVASIPERTRILYRRTRSSF